MRALAAPPRIALFAFLGLTIVIPTVVGGKSLPKQVISGADGASITISLTKADLQIEYSVPAANASTAVFVALGTHHDIGSAVVPFQREQASSFHLRPICFFLRS